MDDSQNSALNQKKINRMVNNAMKDFDITKLQAVGYDKIQELASQYIASEDPEVHAFGQELKNIDPTIFELSPAEKELKNLHDILIQRGNTKNEADTIGITILQLAVDYTTRQIIGAMNEQSYREWEQLMAHDPNIFQQMHLLDQTAQMLLGKTYDEIYEDGLKRAIELTVMLAKSQENSKKLFETLTDSQAKAAMAAFDNNQYEVAVQLIYNYVEQNGKQI